MDYRIIEKKIIPKELVEISWELFCVFELGKMLKIHKIKASIRQHSRNYFILITLRLSESNYWVTRCLSLS